MSYKYKLLSDNPVGAWDFSTISNNTNADLTGYGNAASFSSAMTFSSPPLVSNSGSAAKFNLNTSSVVIANTYNIFNVNDKVDTFSIELWLSLNNLFQDNGYSLNQTASGYFINNQLNFMKVLNKVTGSTIARIFYDYDSNSIKYSVPGNNDAYCYLPDNTSTFHVLANYNAGQLSIFVNNKKDYSSTISDYSLINSASYASNTFFVFDGSSINTSNSSSPFFLINNVAFYQYILSNYQIKTHIDWAKKVDNVDQISYLNRNIDYFNISPEDIDYKWYIDFKNNKMSNYTEFYNISSDINGISTTSNDDFSFTNNSSLYLNSSSGAYWSGSSDYLYIQNPKFSIKSKGTIYLQISSSVSSSNQYVFSINNINNYATLYLQKNPSTSSGYYLYLYDEFNKTSTLMASLTNTNFRLARSENVGFSFDESNVYLYAATSSVQQSIDKTSIPNGILLTERSIVALGTNLSNNSASKTDNLMFYSNVGIYNNTISDHFSMSATYSNNKFLYAPLKYNTSVYSYGYITYRFVPGFQTYDIYGTYINWDGPDNITANISYDGGNTWSYLNKNSFITGYDYSYPTLITDLKFEFNRNFSSSAGQKITLNNLRLGTHSLMSLYSDYKNYSLTASTVGNYNTHSYLDESSNIISRPRNIGITFKPDSSSNVLSYAIVSPISSSYKGIDFWLRIDNLQSEKTSSNIYILNTPSYSLYYTASNPVLRFASAQQSFIYINGASVSNGAYKLLQDEYYHIAVSHSSFIVGNALINGGVQNTGSYNANATYGHITLWNTQPSQFDIQNRYNLFIKNVTQTASASDTTLFLRNPNYYEAASGFVTG